MALRRQRQSEQAQQSDHYVRTHHVREVRRKSDFPALVARAIARRRASQRTRHRFALRHGTNDLRAAYRSVPTRQPQLTCVAVWDDDSGKVVYCDVPGHNFGLKSAVVNFNRFPELAAAAARRLLWCITERYYDDNDTCEPDEARARPGRTRSSRPAATNFSNSATTPVRM